MRCKKNIGIMILIMLIIVPLVLSIPFIEISIKPAFYEQEIIRYSYRFMSDEDLLIQYTAGIICKHNPERLLDLKEASIGPDQPFEGEYVYGKVDDALKRDNCTAEVAILSPYSMSFREPFTIIAKPEFSIKLVLSCKDKNCDSKVYFPGNRISFDYTTDTEGPTVSATITMPDKTTKQMTLPGSLVVEQTGTYTLEATAVKEGFKPAAREEMFAVIEKPAEIKSVSLCNGNGICEAKEDSQNCPQDCISVKQCNTSIDSICSAECMKKDPDCVQHDLKQAIYTKRSFFPLLAVGLVVLLFITFSIIVIKKIEGRQ